MEENRITGPGYYPRRPSPHHTVLPVEGLHWWGYFTGSSGHRSGPRAKPGWTRGDYLYICGKDSGVVAAQFQKLMADGDGNISAGIGPDVRECLLVRNNCIVAWTDGTWARYDLGVPHKTQHGRLP